VIDDWRSYRLEDFIPFTPEVYFRLIERVNEAWWPIQFVAIALGLAALILAVRGNTRSALALLAPAWIFSGIVFHLQHYAEINVAATGFGYMFIAQAILLLVLATATSRPDPSRHRDRWRTSIGVAITVVGLLPWPLVSLARSGGWSQSEYIALHPDPTALFTIGMVLLCLRGFKAGLAVLVPVVWGAISILTLIAMAP
jgi:hypothetical protein